MYVTVTAANISYIVAVFYCAGDVITGRRIFVFPRNSAGSATLLCAGNINICDIIAVFYGGSFSGTIGVLTGDTAGKADGGNASAVPTIFYGSVINAGNSSGLIVAFNFTIAVAVFNCSFVLIRNCAEP